MDQITRVFFVCLCGTQVDGVFRILAEATLFQNKDFTMCHKRVQTQCLKSEVRGCVRDKLKDPAYPTMVRECQ
jgi:hypothetical protein